MTDQNPNMHTGFSLPTQKQELVSVKDVLTRNKFLVLYFYPKDNTSGCTKETEDFSSLYEKFKGLDAEVMGISRDSVKSHQKFADKLEIPFELFSDEEENVSIAFDVLKEKSMYGRKYMGIVRSTFIIDQSLSVIKEWRNVKVPGHAEEVCQYLESIS